MEDTSNDPRTQPNRAQASIRSNLLTCQNVEPREEESDKIESDGTTSLSVSTVDNILPKPKKSYQTIQIATCNWNATSDLLRAFPAEDLHLKT